MAENLVISVRGPKAVSQVPDLAFEVAMKLYRKDPENVQLLRQIYKAVETRVEEGICKSPFDDDDKNNSILQEILA